MPRGYYGKQWTDYDQRHPIVAWSRDAAMSEAITRLIAIPEVNAALRARHGAELFVHGSTAFQDRGQTPLAQVGGEWIHTVADRSHAIDRIATDFQALAHDLTVWMESHRDDPSDAASASAQWLAADVIPTLDEWRAFAERERHSWFTRAATSWATFEDWQERLRRLRELARAHGILLQSADPVPLPKTLWQHGSSGQGSEIAPWVGFLKITIFGAMTLTGIAALYAALRDLARGRDRT